MVRKLRLPPRFLRGLLRQRLHAPPRGPVFLLRRRLVSLLLQQDTKELHLRGREAEDGAGEDKDGGRRREDVIGRGEDAEFPVIEDGAFEIEGAGNESRLGFKIPRKRKNLVDREFLYSYVSTGGISRHSMRYLIGSIRVVGAQDFHCDQWIEDFW